MAPPTHKRLFPNPFYVILLIVSTAFAITALGYFVSPMMAQKALRQAGNVNAGRSLAMARWFDKNGPVALGIELGLMFLLGLLAMATDHWFSSGKSRGRTETKSWERNIP